jgi:DNA-binding transcriptional MerR regulator
VTLRLYRASEVCEMAELQPYVLRSWEKEFPGIGIQRTPDGPRLYRQADVDQVRRIKQLVFGEGLTVSGARRKMEDAGPPRVSEAEAAEVLSTLGSAARMKVASVRDGLKALQAMLAQRPGDFVLSPPPVKPARPEKGAAAKIAKPVAAKPERANGKVASAGKPAKSIVSKRAPVAARGAKKGLAKRRAATA